MRRFAVILGLLALTACNDGPQLGLGFNVGQDGVRVSPTVSGNVGGVQVGVAGQGVDL